MATPARTYQQEMHRNLGLFATWLPGDRLDLGDIGVLEAGRFRKQTSLRELGIREVAGPKGSAQNLQYTSTSGTETSVETDAKVGSGIEVQANIKINFNRSGAFLFHASKAQNIRLENSLELADAIVAAYEAERWQVGWYLVEAIYVADCATIIVCEDNSADLILRASADGELGSIPLANPRARLNISSSRGRMVHILSGRKVHPLYSCLKLKESWFKQPSLVPVRGAARDPGDLPFVRPRISDLLDS
jgi:hypothetical protein